MGGFDSDAQSGPRTKSKLWRVLLSLYESHSDVVDARDHYAAEATSLVEPCDSSVVAFVAVSAGTTGAVRVSSKDFMSRHIANRMRAIRRATAIPAFILDFRPSRLSKPSRQPLRFDFGARSLV